MTCGAHHTGVFLTDEERVTVDAAITKAQQTPVLMIGGYDTAHGAWQRAKEAVHAAALAHDLPEIPGFYGYNPTTGEVLS